MTDPGWPATTHSWAAAVDTEHLAAVRARRRDLAPGGALHLLLEVLAYAADEAEHLAASGGEHRRGGCTVVLHDDGAVSVADDGRGTDTRFDAHGRPVRKPVLATRDLRFFDAACPPLLPDGHPRRGMSVVAALSRTAWHLNRRAEGAWVQRYEDGVPVTGLRPVPADGSTGTTVLFRPARDLEVLDPDRRAEVAELCRAWPWLDVEVGAGPALVVPALVDPAER